MNENSLLELIDGFRIFRIFRNTKEKIARFLIKSNEGERERERNKEKYTIHCISFSRVPWISNFKKEKN